MSSLRNIPFILLVISQSTVAFQPLTRPTVNSFPSAKTSQSTFLSAFKTEQDVRNTTEIVSSSSMSEDTTPAVIQDALLQQEKELMLQANNNNNNDDNLMNGALFDLSKELIEENDESATAAEEMSAMEGLLWKGSVVLLCALWASNFPVAKLIMAEPGVDSSLYALTRFGVSALALAPGAIASARRTGMDWETLKGALICGGWVSFGYLGQTLGLLSTTASKSCVICSLHCVFVAAIAEWMRVNKAKEVEAALSSSSSSSIVNDNNTQYDFKRLVPAAIAVAGVAIVELKGAAGGANIGDLLSFAQPIGFGLGYLLLEDLMAKRPETALPVSAIKLAVVALASFALFELTPLVTEGGGLDSAWSFTMPDFSPIIASSVALGGILYTGLVTTALALWFESIAFARVSATDASLILTTEPLFAAALGAYTLGETFGLSDYAGASLIIGACVLATVMDSENRDESCEITDDDCEVPRQTPFGGL